MKANEEYLKTFLCSECHVAMLEPHSEEQYKNQSYYKCVLCGFTKQVLKEKLEIHKIIYGNPKEN